MEHGSNRGFSSASLRILRGGCYQEAMPRSWVRIAHRGASGSAPELTRAAFDRALAIGVDMIEVDVQLTSDDHPIILHDDTLDRTTSGAGPVRAQRWADIRKLDAGSWFAPEFADQRVLDLAELLDLAVGRVRMNLEIKAPAEDWNVLIPRLLAEVRNARMDESAIISCFDVDALRLVRAHDPEIAVGVLWYLPEWDEAFALVDELRAHAIHPYLGTTQAESLARAEERGIATYVWTVNEVDDMRHVIDSGAAGVMSDHPERFAAVEGECG